MTQFYRCLRVSIQGALLSLVIFLILMYWSDGSVYPSSVTSSLLGYVVFFPRQKKVAFLNQTRDWQSIRLQFALYLLVVTIFVLSAVITRIRRMAAIAPITRNGSATSVWLSSESVTV